MSHSTDKFEDVMTEQSFVAAAHEIAPGVVAVVLRNGRRPVTNLGPVYGKTGWVVGLLDVENDRRSGADEDMIVFVDGELYDE